MIARATGMMERPPMKRALRFLPAMAATLAAAVAVLLATGCGKKLPSGPVRVMWRTRLSEVSSTGTLATGEPSSV